ncbi:MAG TPA: tRNA pseudouridine(55) synthase TruB [Longimicrobiales bacterium]
MTGEAAAGVLPIDKPEGPTSHDVVAMARRALNTRRIGHTGTLDPFASGLLLLCIGWATRIAEYLSGLPKTYIAVARLGVSTDTADRTGAVTGTSERWRELSRDEIVRAFQAQVGSFLQVPPRYSAKKVAGVPLHRRVRRGEDVEASPVRVTIHELEVLDVQPPDVRFRVRCSAGTYVRAIARDVGEALGTGGHLTALRRTRIGPHDVEAALSIRELHDPAARQRAMLSPAEALSHLPAVDIGAREAAQVLHGRTLPPPPGTPPEGPVRVLHAGRLLAIAEADGGALRPRKVFPDA